MAHPRKRGRQHFDSDVEDDSNDYTEEEEEDEIELNAKKRRSTRTIRHYSESDEDEPVPSAPPADQQSSDGVEEMEIVSEDEMNQSAIVESYAGHIVEPVEISKDSFRVKLRIGVKAARSISEHMNTEGTCSTM